MNGICNLPNSFDNKEIRVKAFKADTRELIGEYASCKEACRKLYIRNSYSISIYLKGGKGSTFKGKRRGVASYKTGIKYHFEKA